MFNRSLLFWKLSSVFVAIILGLVGGMGYVNNRVDERYAISSARDVCWFRAETILHSLKTLMMSRDNAAIDELMENLPPLVAARGVGLGSTHSAEPAFSRSPAPRR